MFDNISFMTVFAGAIITWRVTMLLFKEDGPFDIVAKFRDFVGVYYDEYSECHGKNVISNALCCYKCTSVWIGWAVSFIFLGGITLQSLLFGLLLSGLTIIIQIKVSV